MEKEKKLQLISEIKQMERELYLKKSQLTSYEIIEHPRDKSKRKNTKNNRQRFLRLIKQVGLLSTGGNSVEDIKLERQR